MPVTKTNAAYAHLAYRRSIVLQLVDELRESYLALSSEEPKKEVLCGDVYQEDAVVPPDELEQIIDELEQEGQNLELQMREFTFTQERQRHGLLSSKKAEASNEDGQGTSAKKGRRKGRRAR